MARRLKLVASALFLVTAALSGAAGCDVITAGCGDELESELVVTYSAGTARDGIYRSSSWAPSDWIDFPPGASIRFEHTLEDEPRAWQAYVATARTGDGAKLVLATGNEVEMTAIDEESITVHNGTCVDLFVVMVAMSGVPM